jgi:uncharacterized paraquat-inducible protein A
LLDDLVACPDCDLLQRIPALPPGGAARCPRCGRTIAGKPASPDRVLALTVTAAIVLAIANATPLMGLSAMGRRVSTTIFGGVLAMWLRGEEVTAALMAFCAVAAPIAYIGLMLTILLAVRRAPAPSWAGTLLRLSKRRTTSVEPARGGDYADLIAAHSRALGRLSAEIAAAIQEMKYGREKCCWPASDIAFKREMI